MFDSRSELIELKDALWLKRQMLAGSAVAAVLRLCGTIIKEKPPNLSLKDLENNAIDILSGFKCEPTFKGYKGFPSAICASVNKQLVHGIVTDYVLQEGDIVSVDLGATFEGAIADAAYTYVYGNTTPRILEMIKACKDSLHVGINAVKIGNRIGVIGNAIDKFIKPTGFGLIDKYGGHGINYNTPHAAPFVNNKSLPFNGVRFQPGMSIAIEPMLVLTQDLSTRVLEDKWTVMSADISCHFEHSVTIDFDGEVHIITKHGLL